MERWAADAGVDVADDGYAFTLDPSGAEPIKPDGLSHSFATLCQATLLFVACPCTLRHFSASMLIASGRDVRTIAGRLGHSDATTTLRVYAHMVEGRDQDAADYLGSLLVLSLIGHLFVAGPPDEDGPVDPVEAPDDEALGDLAKPGCLVSRVGGNAEVRRAHSRMLMNSGGPKNRVRRSELGSVRYRWVVVVGGEADRLLPAERGEVLETGLTACCLRSVVRYSRRD